MKYWEVIEIDKIGSRKFVVTKFENEKEARKYADFLNIFKADAKAGYVKYDCQEVEIKLNKSADNLITKSINKKINKAKSTMESLLDENGEKPKWGNKLEEYTANEKRLKRAEKLLKSYTQEPSAEETEDKDVTSQELEDEDTLSR